VSVLQENCLPQESQRKWQEPTMSIRFRAVSMIGVSYRQLLSPLRLGQTTSITCDEPDASEKIKDKSYSLEKIMFVMCEV